MKVKQIRFLLLAIPVLGSLVGGPTLNIMAQDVISSASVNTSTLPVVEDPLSRTESMIHTAVQIKIYHEGQEALMDQAIDYIKRMEALLSTNLEGSDVAEINEAAGKEPVKVEPETFELIRKALEVSELSGGNFDITIGAVNDLWRIGQDDARVPSQEEIDQALTKIDYHKVILDEANQTVFLEETGMRIELGGISKGYIGSGIATMFYDAGITTAIINLGGNVIVMGTSPTNENGWNVGVQDPDEVRGATVGSQRVKDYAVITSGIYERFLEVDGVKYHHILDPKTGYPLENDISGVTVFAPTSVDGDALSTSLFLFGIKDGLEFVNQQEGIEAVFIDKDHHVYLSDGLKDSFVLSNEEYQLAEIE